MFNTRRVRLLFFALFAISIILPLYLYPQLPYRIASHFGINNKADNWTNKSSYIIMHYALILSISSLFYGLAHFIHKLPSSLMNLPHKAYWLSEDRKNKAYCILQGMLYWIGSLCLLLFLYVFIQVYKANVNGTYKLDNFSWFAVIIFLFGNGIILLRYISFFNNKETN